jgi:hypothetical protein
VDAPSKPLRFSVNDITVGDMEDIEEITGESFEDVIEKLSAGGDKLRVPLKVIKAIVFVVKRQSDPDFTLDQARRVKFSELELELEGAPADPTSPAG